MDYFCGGECDEKKAGLIWEVPIKAYNGQLLGVANCGHPNAAALFTPPDACGPDLFTYIRSGGLEMVRKFGIKGTARMESFELFADKIKKKYTADNCRYLFGFVSRRKIRGTGCGSRVLSPVLSSSRYGALQYGFGVVFGYGRSSENTGLWAVWLRGVHLL